MSLARTLHPRSAGRLAGPSATSRGGRDGFSLAELLVVMAILALSIAVAVPLVSHQVRMARVRAAASQLSSDLKAARMIAVSTRRTVDVQIVTTPASGYAYTDARGRERRIEMPEGVRIISAPPTISFRPDGSLSAAAVTVLETTTSGEAVERWTIRMNVLGLTTTTHQRLE